MTAGIDDGVLMTMAGIAYAAPGDVAGYLQQARPTAAWTVNWLPDPGTPPDNFAYMARRADSNAYVLAIRGTYPDPFSQAYWDDASQDSPFGDMVDWPGAPGAKIAKGTNTAFGNLRALRDTHGCSLQDIVRTLPANASVTVTGHSLGGTLTPLIALQLAETFPQLTIQASSFAGMTPGNSAFAALFGSGTKLEGCVRRVFNTLDTVAYGWDKVYATHDFYSPAPKGGVIVSAMLLATAARLQIGGYDFTAVGTPVPLQGEVRKPVIPCELVAYVLENVHQHMPDTYLCLLGAPPLPFSIGFGSILRPRDKAADATPAAALRLDVGHLQA